MSLEMLLEVGERRERVLTLLVAHGTGKLPQLLRLLEVGLVLEVALARLVEEHARELQRPEGLGAAAREDGLLEVLLQKQSAERQEIRHLLPEPPLRGE